ncbi:MAG: tRNA pseudouridine(55) synthase TruB [Phycisphaerae bacterium]|nr:tRNA pseudouridine(55) synthase TruB [Phycisphaerae bacterium]
MSSRLGATAYHFRGVDPAHHHRCDIKTKIILPHRFSEPAENKESPIDIDGIINVNKPTGATSARVVDWVRRITGVRKSGHAGTLDPAADGVLIICQGRATKLVEQFMGLPKVYRTVARLDVTSSSFDSDRPHEPVEIARVPSESEVIAALARFVGKIQQVPPAVSALKIGGQPSYKLERQGRAVELAPREVQIYSNTLLSYAWPEIRFDTHCGRGTYIRALIRDLGAALGVGGCLTGLTRLAIGPFRVEEAWTRERMEQAKMADYLIPIERARELLTNRP